MKVQNGKYILYSMLCLFVTLIFVFLFVNTKNIDSIQREIIHIKSIGDIQIMNNEDKWTRCFLSADGIIYFKNHKISVDRGKSRMDQFSVDLEEINRAPERAVFSSDRLFYALDGPTTFLRPGVYKGRSWRSNDNLKSLKQEVALFNIPDGAIPRKDIKKWFGLFVYRTILMMPDSSWLMTMYGNFKSDTLVPADKDASAEIQFMGRTLIVTSNDEGHSWNYLSSVAIPRAGEPIGEGYVEPAITLLKDGKLLCVMRTGHHYPLYSSWSSDMGKTWTPPLYTGLDRGCDPCLITLHDGRVALSWGRRFPEGWSIISPGGDKGRFSYPGEGYTSLSLSNDGGLSWNSNKILQKSGTCYSTIFEVEPNLVFMQVDKWYCRIQLIPLTETKQ
jgi:hypothetical protein